MVGSIFVVFNPFAPNRPFLYPLKTSETVRCFQGVEKGCIENKWVKNVWWLRLSFKTQLKVEFILPFSGSRTALNITLDRVWSIPPLRRPNLHFFPIGGNSENSFFWKNIHARILPMAFIVAANLVRAESRFIAGLLSWPRIYSVPIFWRIVTPDWY